ncbi:MAG: DsbA family protein, partial [Actinobacteria bacterium]|nr:DsbA family protein [Actinomycetota bacterium]
MGEKLTSVEFWFDPICPWCWMTSRWATEVAGVRGFEIAWHPISLKIINEGNHDDSHADAHAAGHRLGRVVEAA